MIFEYSAFTWQNTVDIGTQCARHAIFYIVIYQWIKVFTWQLQIQALQRKWKTNNSLIHQSIIGYCLQALNLQILPFLGSAASSAKVTPMMNTKYKIC